MLIHDVTRQEAGEAADELNDMYDFDASSGFVTRQREALRKVYLALRDAERRAPRENFRPIETTSATPASSRAAPAGSPAAQSP